ncbi:MAG: 1-acyl-sn-glycerol-3-phosphate acyltransferase [Bellilinea sp.]|nr:1-acyl-sn-glycerol-3-phosphate acyltransferase [Bellilinea sp.]
MEELAITYPRRKVIRSVLRQLIRAAFHVLSDFTIEGAENLPGEGPLLVIGNHFSFIDPVAVIGSVPYPIEYVGGFRMPNAPQSVTWLAGLYGFLPVRRGSISRDTLYASRKVLQLNGVLGIFPEAGSWASFLRPARPGAAYLASSTRAKILPVGLDGLTDLFPMLRKGKRARVTVHFGKPFGPFFVSERGETNRNRLEEIGHEMMRQIARLIPPERRGFYSEDPQLRQKAMAESVYPWENKPEE